MDLGLFSKHTIDGGGRLVNSHPRLCCKNLIVVRYDTFTRIVSDIKQAVVYTASRNVVTSQRAVCKKSLTEQPTRHNTKCTPRYTPFRYLPHLRRHKKLNAPFTWGC